MNIVEQALEEAGAGPARIVSHIRKGTPFFLISAQRADLSLEHNKQRTEVLKRKLADLPGCSFIETAGEYQEDGQDLPSTEQSFFVMPRSANTNVTKFHEVANKLMTAFGQEAILVGDGEEISLHTADGDEIVGSVATLDPAIIRHLPGHTQVGGTKFGFTSPDIAPAGVQYGTSRNVA